MVTGINYFEFLDKKSIDFGIVVTKANTYISSEKDIKFISIPGYNGDYYQDNQRRKNIIVEYQCSVIPLKKFQSRQEQLSAISSWLNGEVSGYSKLFDSYNPDIYRQALFHKGLEPKYLTADVYDLKISFTCKPLKYEIEGENAITKVNDNGITLTLTNDIATDSYPLIVLTPASTEKLGMNFKLNNTNWYVEANSVVFFDSEQGKVYNNSSFYLYHNGDSENFIAPTGMPTLVKGTNIIEIETPEKSNIGEFLIYPRWCRI